MADQPDSALQGAFASPFVTEVPPAAVMRLLSRYEREQLAGFIAVAIDLLDLADPDPDREGSCDEDEISRSPDMGPQFMPEGPGCEIGDTGENAWIEWHNMRGSQKGGPNIASENEDDEEDNEDRGLDEAEPHFVTLRDLDGGAGCPIADPGGCEHDGREEEPDAEREQMGDDVPALRVYSLDHNIFSDKRVYLGRSNMMSSFVVGGEGERSADTGAIHKGGAPSLLSRPGVPV